jgi:hypothetical protein
MPRVPKLSAKVRIPPKNPFYGFINVFENSYLVGSRKMLLRMGRDLASRLRASLRAQAFNWVPLSEKYKKYKAKHGLDPRMLIATGDYINAITVIQRADGTVEVGLRDQIHLPSGLPVKTLMRIHEYGTSTIPARPWWRPTVSKFRKEIGQTRAEFRKMQNKKVRAWLKRRGAI